MTSLTGYILIARPHHWFKNIFVLPGYICALFLSDSETFFNALNLLLTLLGISLAASANYVLNEWLDARFDAHHPEKKGRPSVVGKVTKIGVFFEYGVLFLVALVIARSVSVPVFVTVFTLLLFGFFYNVEPFRCKEKAYLDIIVESANNPIRFLAGWFVLSHSLPPVSILLSFWMAGAFLMSVKRYAELRFLGDQKVACRYRRSFRYYSEEKLLLLSLFYAMNFAFFLGIFLIKHRIEFLFSFPLFSILFCWYLFLGMKKNSPAQRPERLYQEKNLLLFLTFIFSFLLVLLWVDMPILRFFLE